MEEELFSDELILLINLFTSIDRELVEIENMYNFIIDVMNKKIIEFDEMFINTINDAKTKNDTKIINDLFNQNGISYNQHKNIFPLIFRNSILLAIISNFENNMNLFCDQLATLFDLEIKYQDLSGKGVERNQKYLVKFIGINKWQQENNWSELKVILKIRNLIAHNGSSMQDDEQCVKKYIEKGYLVLNEKRTISLDDRFIKYTLTTIKNVWESIKKEIQCILFEKIK